MISNVNLGGSIFNFVTADFSWVSFEENVRKPRGPARPAWSGRKGLDLGEEQTIFGRNQMIFRRNQTIFGRNQTISAMTSAGLGHFLH